MRLRQVTFRSRQHAIIGKPRTGFTSPAEVYPAPLVLPGDDLSLDPKSLPQSVQSWQRAQERNLVTRGKNVIYIAPPAGVDPHTDFIDIWTHPQHPMAPADTESRVPQRHVPGFQTMPGMHMTTSWTTSPPSTTHLLSSLFLPS